MKIGAGDELQGIKRHYGNGGCDCHQQRMEIISEKQN
jgi:hypothetical protein